MKLAFAIGFLVVLGAAVFWCLYTRLAGKRSSNTERKKGVPSMGEDDIRRIEKALNVEFPEPCTTFLTSPRPRDIDEVTILADPDLIIKWTQQYRSGFCGANPWPPDFVCLGDESDACPYALDCSTGAFIQTDHGALNRKPLVRYASFAEFIAEKCAGNAERA